jgi:small-conductance mechanosensitive channel
MASFLHLAREALRALLAPCLALALGMAAPGPAAGQTSLPQRLEAIGADLQAIEADLAREALDDAALARASESVAPLVEQLRAVIAAETPKLAAIEARLKELGEAPPPDAAAGEAPEVAREREEQKRQFNQVQAGLRLARSLSARADAVALEALDRRRDLFAQALLQPFSSILSPLLWIDVARILPVEAAAMGRVFGTWQSIIAGRLTWRSGALLGGLLLALLIAIGPVRRLLRRFEGRDAETAQPSRLARAAAALRVVLGYTLVVSIVMIGLYMLLEALRLLPGRLPEVMAALLSGVALVAFAGALARAFVPVDLPAWRLFVVSDQSAARQRAVTLTLSGLIVAARVTEAINGAIFASLPLTVAARGSFALLFGLVLLSGVWRRDGGEENDLDRLRVPVLAAAVAILGAVALGYIPLGAFLVDQFVWVASILLLLRLSLILVDEAIGGGLSSEGRIGARIRGVIGLRSGMVDQISVLLAGLIRLALYVVAVFYIVAPWGLARVDLLSTFEAVLFGFTIGGVTISLSGIVIAIGLFALGFVATRSVQRWLRETYLPRTALDQGIRNSITTSFGYIGVIAAAILALSSAGLSLDRLAIVAGALSVGIGFGLQSIVSNFVSGLILLWERPLKVGDWLEVGQEQGIVRNIKVRATEIETFDKASLIVPNSEFISGRVKNWVYSGRKARIVIPVAVSHDSDPTTVEATLLELALAHREVESEPKPRVFFRRITNDTLDFELTVFADVDALASTRSDLLFAIVERFRKAGVRLGPRTGPAP